MATQTIRRALAHVGLALRNPDDFALAWDRRTAAYDWPVWAALFLTAVLGTFTYGMTMGVLGGGREVIYKGMACTTAAGLAWGIPLPALYILNSLGGSRLSPSSTLLAALVTTSWGGLAMIASIPINWFFTAAVPHPWFILLVNLVVFAGVGASMVDVFQRVMHRIDPQSAPPLWWLVLVGAIGGELFFFFGLFQFPLVQA